MTYRVKLAPQHGYTLFNPPLTAGQSCTYIPSLQYPSLSQRASCFLTRVETCQVVYYFISKRKSKDYQRCVSTGARTPN
ncbi:hypothetical protein GcM3_127003 [Golovinomyces cichoracearum]|uniref:Uncharacterized protein n=1 Tax=Golovinomyces cichoracearum TaxID=62708 RepID=A0A420I5W4_9PEZI|nr:hypothetical protein GcM3_127003 [Golovinomyces cichoracearum]